MLNDVHHYVLGIEFGAQAPIIHICDNIIMTIGRIHIEIQHHAIVSPANRELLGITGTVAHALLAHHECIGVEVDRRKFPFAIIIFLKFLLAVDDTADVLVRTHEEAWREIARHFGQLGIEKSHDIAANRRFRNNGNGRIFATSAVIIIAAASSCQSCCHKNNSQE